MFYKLSRNLLYVLKVTELFSRMGNTQTTEDSIDAANYERKIVQFRI